MEAPKCMACQTRHWTTQPCPARKESRRPENPAPGEPKGAPTEETGTPGPRRKSAAERVAKWRDKNREEYNRRQRELMRKRRKSDGGTVQDTEGG